MNAQAKATPQSNRRKPIAIFALAAILILLCLDSQAQGTAFTYQGRLNDGASPANGSYDLTFALFDAASAGAQEGSTLTNAATAVSNGLFTVTLDFGNQFPGADRWLELGVATNGSGSFATLTPRQLITATPYATRASSASSADTATTATTAATAAVASSVNASNIAGALLLTQLPANLVTNNQADVTLTGVFGGNGNGLSNLNAATLSGIVPLPQIPAAVVTNGETGLTLSGAFSGSGAGLSGVDLRFINGAGAITFSTNTGFALSSTYAVGSAPRSVAIADFNNDGRQDLVAANSGSSLLSVLTNNGSGGFATASTLGVGNSPYSVLAVDVNGDGKKDLVCGNYSSGTLSVLTNNGSGGFATASTPSLGMQPYFLSAADVNADGRTDVIIANINGASLMVMTNNGSGGFVQMSSVGIGAQPYAVVVADVSGDGKLDLISANAAANSLSVVTNTGSGGFAFASSFSAGGTFPVSVTAADVNGDGKVDLISANYSANTCSILTNNGSGSFTLTATPTVGGSPNAVTTADVNGDGKVDLISANNSGNSLSILTNNGAGGFALAATPGVGASGPWAVAAGDLTGDGRVDLVSANISGSLISVVVNLQSTFANFIGNGGGLTNLDATKIVGTLATAQIPNLDASKITSGIFSTAQIPSLDASKITSGIFSSGLIPNLDASKITSGTLSDLRLSANIPRLNANNEFSGTNGLNDDDLHFRNSADANHGVGWYGSTGPIKPFAGFGPDGPILYGYQAGGLGTTIAGQRLALMWNSAGNVGIGKTNPASVLDVNGTVTATSFSGNGSALNSLNVANFVGTLLDSQLSSNAALLDRAAQTFTGGTNNFNGAVHANVFRARGGAPGPYGANNNGYAFFGNNGDTDSGMFSSADGQLEFYNTAAERMRIVANGYVGIGTTNPLAPLHIKGANSFPHVKIAADSSAPYGTFLSLDATATTGGKDYLIFSTGGSAGEGQGRLVFKNETDGQYCLTLNANGNVGIGTNSPAQKLHVAGNILASGTVIASSFVGGLAGNGSSVTNLDAGNLSSGTLLDARLSPNVALLASANAFTATNRFAGVVLATNVANQFVGSFTGNGGGLTNLNATTLVGTVADQRLSANVALLNANQTFSGVVTASNVNNRFVGTIEVPYVRFSDTRNKNVGAGAASAGAINLRTFNTNQVNPPGWVALLGTTTNTLTLPVGTYQCQIVAPGLRVGRHQARLRISTASTTNLVYGTSEFADNQAGGDTTKSTISGQFSLAAPASLVVEHYTQFNGDANSLGGPVNAVWTEADAKEIYAVAEFWKIK